MSKSRVLFLIACASLAACKSRDSFTQTYRAKAKALFEADFAMTVDDPRGDSGPKSAEGDVGYSYPDKVPGLEGGIEGAGDILSFGVAFDRESQNIRLSVTLAKVTGATRIGVTLLDEAAFHAQPRAFDYVIGGVELKVPKWNGHGVNLLLGPRDDPNPLDDADGYFWDYTARFPKPPEIIRPDNSIFVSHEPTQILAKDSSGAISPVEVKAGMEDRLRADAVRVEGGSGQGTKLEYSLPLRLIKDHLDVKTRTLYVLPYTFIVVPDQARMDYGAFEIKAAEGGSDEAWYDPDVYDLVEVRPPFDQKSLLDYSKGEVPVLDKAGQGFMVIGPDRPGKSPTE